MEDAIRSSMPPGAVFAGGEIRDAQQPLFAEEDVAVRNAVPKRRAEFRAGRTFARAALLELGITPVAIVAGPDRAPMWPPGVVASITHDDTYCGAMAARSSDYAAVGIDIESSAPLDADLVRSICSATELEHGAALGDTLSVDFPKLVFCAKESAYKAYFSLARTFLEFSDMEIRVSPRDGTFVGTVLPAAPPIPELGRTIGGRFLTSGDHLITWAAIPQRVP
jgi:4'-phosphopantetheinyl transferase EntD